LKSIDTENSDNVCGEIELLSNDSLEVILSIESSSNTQPTTAVWTNIGTKNLENNECHNVQYLISATVDIVTLDLKVMDKIKTTPTLKNTMQNFLILFLVTWKMIDGLYIKVCK
jgi:hypothetical protein